jgi:hypothetical protein
MTISLPARLDLLPSQRRRPAVRALAFLVALVVLLVSLSAEAKKKKPAKKHKTPAAKTKSKGKEALPPEPEAESDEASSDEKPSSSRTIEPDEEKEAKPPAPPPEDDEAGARKPARAAKPAAAPEDSDTGGGLSALRLGFGGRALFRSLSWTGAGGALAPYSLSPGPEVGLWLEAFPAAFATDGFAANIGVFGQFNYGVGASSKTMSGTTLTTKYQDFLFGLKVRIPFGGFIPFVAGAYGMQKFALEPVDATRPNFNYSFLHLGGGARIQPTPSVDIHLGAAFLYVMSLGAGANDVGTLYTRSTATGVDLTLSFGLRLTSLLGLRAGFDFRQFGVALNRMSADTSIPAAGALDRNIALWGGLELVFDGVGGGGGGEGEEAPVKKPAKAKKPPREAEPEESDKSEDE